MKKRNIKYIGSAVAVALLAAGSPIIINQIAPSTVVEAAGQAITNPDLTPTQMLTAFRNQFDDRYVASTDSLTAALQNIVKTDQMSTDFFYFSPNKLQHIYDIQNNAGINGLKDQDPSKIQVPYYFGTSPRWQDTDYYYRDIMGYFSIRGAGKDEDEQLSTLQDILDLADRITKGTVKLPIIVGVHLRQGSEGNYATPSLQGVPDNLKDFYFKIDTSRLDITKDTKPTSVSTGTSTSDSPLQSGNNSLLVTDNYSNKYSDSEDMARTPIYGKSLFTSSDAALKYAKSDTFDPTDSTQSNAGDTVNSTGKIIKGGTTYYQTVSYKLDNGKDKAIENVISSAIDPLTQSVLRPYETYINGSSTQGVDGTDYAFNRSLKSGTTDQYIGMITVVRPIVVAGKAIFNFTSPKVTVNSSASLADNSKLSDTSGDKLIDEYGNEVATSKIEPGETYYTDAAATNVANDAVVDGKFVKAETYYRKITFTLSGDTSNLSFSSDKVASTKNTVTFSQPVIVQNSVSANINSVNSTVGSPVSDDVSDDTLSNAALIDSSRGNNGVSFGTKYYKDNGDSAYDSLILDNKATAETDVVDASNNFAKTGAYLRTITFYLTKGAIANNSFDAVDPNVRVNKEESTVTYVQHIKINAVGIKPKIENLNVPMGTQTSDIKLAVADNTKDTLVDGDTSLLDTNKGVNGIGLGTIYYDDPQLNTEDADIQRTGRLENSTTYYRTIKFYLTDDAYNKYSFPGSYGEPNATEKSVTYVQSVTVNQAGTATFANKVLTVAAGTTPSGTDIDGTKLTDTSSYTLDDDDTKASIITKNSVIIGDYYGSETDAKDRTNPLEITFFEPNKTYYRLIAIKVNSGDGYAYTYPGADSVDKDNDIVIFIQAIKVNKDSATVNVGTINTTSGSMTSTLDNDFTGDSVENSTGSIVTDNGISFGSTYYDKSTEALSGDTSKKTARVTSDGEITGSGNLYRTITFNLKAGAGSENIFTPGTLNTDYVINGDKITYVQTINVSPVAATATINPVNGIQAGTKTSDSQNFENSDITANGTSIVDGDGRVAYGTTYYDSIDDFKNNKPSNDIGSDNTFTAVHPYYREVTIHLTTNSASAYEFSGDNFVSVDKANNTVTYLQEVKVQTEPTQANIADLHTLTGIPIGDTKLNDTTGYTVTDSTGSIVADGDNSIQFGTDYFAKVQDVMDGNSPITDTVFSDGSFIKNGPVYRTVTINLKSGAIDRDAFGEEINGVTPRVNGSTSVTYVQKIDVEQNAATAKIISSTVNASTSVNDVPESNGNTLTDKTGHTVIAANGIQFDNSGKFYDGLEDYKNGKVSSDIVDGKFSVAKTYYRAITFALTPSAAKADEFLGNDLAGTNTTTNTVTYLQPVIVVNNIATANIKGITTTTATPSNDDSLKTANGSDIVSKYNSQNFGSIVADGGISYGTSYYDSEDDWYSDTPSQSVKDNKFLKSRDYYRTITFKLTPNALLANDLSTVPKFKQNSDGSVSYAQLVHVDSSTVTPTVVDAMADAESSVKTEQDSEKNNIKDSDGKTLVSHVDYGNTYYVDGSDPTKVLNGTATVDPEVVQNGDYVKAGTYYRTLTFTLNGDALDANTLAETPEHQLSKDGKTVTYVQKVIINSINAKVTVSPVNAKVGDVLDTTTNNDTLNLANDKQTQINADVSLGSLYKSSNGALNSISGNEATDAISGGKFIKAGTYYRLVTFKPTAGTLGGYKFNDSNVHVNIADGTVTYVQTITVGANQVEPVTDKSATVTVGSSVKAEQNGEQNKVQGNNGNSIVNSVTFGNYYSTTNNNEADVLNGSAKNIATGVTSGDTYAKTGAYYRTVTFNLKDNVLDSSSFDKNIFKVDEAANTATFVQTITINKINAKVTVNVANAKIGDSINNLPSADGYTLNTDDANSAVIPANAKADTKVYKDQDLTKLVTGDKFDEAGTYYRAITFTPTANPADYYNVKDATVNSDGTITYVQAITVGAGQVEPVTDKSVTVTVGSSVKDEQNGEQNYVQDSNDNSIVNSVTFGNYYSTDDNNESDVLNGSAKNIATGVTSGDTYAKTGTYYRTVTFNLKDNALKNNSFDKNVFKVDEAANTATFVQTITINKINAKVTVNVANAKIGDSINNLPSADGYTLNTDDANSAVIPANAKADTKVYKDQDLTKLVTGDKFDEAGTYYRAITFTPTANPADYYNVKDATVNSDGTITYVQAINVTAPGVTAATVKVDTVTSTVGSAVSTLPATNKNYTLTADGKNIAAEASAGTTVYKSYSAGQLSDPVTSFDTAGTYYRVITFKVVNDSDQYTFTDPNVISNKDGIITYIQAINVTAPEVTAATVKVDKVTSTVGNLVSTLPATNEKYTLKTADGKTIKAEVSAGITVYKNYDAGKLSDPITSFDTAGTYYRVITFKAADADKYSFTDRNVISNKDGVITYIQPISVGQESGVKVSQAVTDTKNVKVDVDGEDSSLSSKAGYSLTDADGNSLIDAPTAVAGISFSPEYYIMKDNTLKPADSSDAHGYTIAKKGTYYRRVIFKVSANTIANYDFSAIKGEINKTDSTVSFLQKIDASTNPATATIDSPSVSYNTSSDAASLKDPTGVTLQDGKGNAINSGNPVFSGIFSTKQNAQNATSDDGNVTGDLKEGSYYQRVTFPLAENDNNAYDFGDGIVSQDGKSVTYIREITVKPSTSTGGGSNTGGNTGNNTGSNTGNNNNSTGTGDEDDWTYYYDNYGVVTTKTDQDSYQLNNHANEAIENRELGKDTSWKTDQYRTNREGVKQYRVATNEWIDSNDVYFVGNEDDWTYYYDNYGVVTTKTGQDSYQLNNRANEMIKNRELDKNTSWKTDQYRTNRAGVKQYCVATNEWIDSRDVYLIDNEDDWTYYKDPGVVRTVIGQAYYSLKNRANETVNKRALIEQSSWLTDQYRTNRAGVKQYRVATNEWIDSRDVTFIKNIKGIVNVNEASSYYKLYNIDREVIKNRALQKDTSWLADKEAIDPAGNVYYRVATNEWVKKVEGVYLDTNAWY
ncbi:beta strand repeat-containing protein [Companilactobacillus kimchii]|nr:hypothetical protein [Companilactobacillus kimchii]